MTKRRKVVVCDLPDYEDLVAEIYVQERFVGLVTQEKKRGEFFFEISKTEDIELIPLDDLLESLSLARRRLIEIG